MFVYSRLISIAVLCVLTQTHAFDKDSRLLRAVNRGNTDSINNVVKEIVERMAVDTSGNGGLIYDPFGDLARTEIIYINRLALYLNSLTDGIENVHDHEVGQYVAILSNVTRTAGGPKIAEKVKPNEFIILPSQLPDREDAKLVFDVAFSDAMSLYALNASEKTQPIRLYLRQLPYRMCSIWTKMLHLNQKELAKQIEEVAKYVKMSTTGPAEISAVFSLLRYVEYATNVLHNLVEKNIDTGAGLFTLKHKDMTITAAYLMSQVKFYADQLPIIPGSDMCVRKLPLPIGRESILS